MKPSLPSAVLRVALNSAALMVEGLRVLLLVAEVFADGGASSLRFATELGELSVRQFVLLRGRVCADSSSAASSSSSAAGASVASGGCTTADDSRRKQCSNRKARAR
jgi:hypothetical protein